MALRAFRPLFFGGAPVRWGALSVRVDRIIAILGRRRWRGAMHRASCVGYVPTADTILTIRNTNVLVYLYRLRKYKI
jgi:hypothetical protein